MKRMPEVKFERELEIFHIDIEIGARSLSAYLAVDSVAASSESVRILLDTAPRFWNTNKLALQISAIMALGRVFDQKTPHNLDSLIRIAQNNLEIFSKEALGRRKQKLGANLSPPELDDCLRSAYEPTPKDFRDLRKSVQKWRRIYQSNYDEIRDKLFAHREMWDRAETYALFAKTNIGELQSFFAFLLSLDQALLLLFINGHKPDLSAPAGRTVKEITQEAKRFLLAAAGVTQPDA